MCRSTAATVLDKAGRLGAGSNDRGRFALPSAQTIPMFMAPAASRGTVFICLTGANARKYDRSSDNGNGTWMTKMQAPLAPSHVSLSRASK
jgi:hypothetical protein